MFFEKCEGYIYDLKDVDGEPFQVALDYQRPFWYATEITTGLSFSPIADKNKLELLKKLSLINVNKALRKPYYKDIVYKLSIHKESENSQ